jgi:hypothetical protein
MEPLADESARNADASLASGTPSPGERQVVRPEQLQGNDYPLWSPRFWHGMTLGDYFRLLWRGRFQVSPTRWHLGVITFMIALNNSVWAAIQFALFDWQIRRQELPRQPVFVIGHFRTGTTMLFEHLACDKQFIWPTTYECFSPRHFLLTKKIFPWAISFLLPRLRPMDNMQAGFDRPQEDEFALLSMSGPTIYRRIAFPNQSAPFMESLTFNDVNSPLFKRWRKQITWFYRAITLRKRKRLLIKSPAHTGRIAHLIKLFPDAKFVHIVRNPQHVFPSTRNALRVLEMLQAFQSQRHDDQTNRQLDEFVLTTLQEMYRGYWEQSASLQENQLCEVRYEELCADPIKEMQRIYRQLSLGDFESIRPALEERLSDVGDYKINCFTANPVRQRQVAEAWSEYAKRYGYA